MNEYDNMLKDIGVSREQVDKVTRSGKVVEFDSCMYSKRESDIHGLGVFAKKDIKQKQIIGLATIDNVIKTTLGRFTNHSDNNNARFYQLKNRDLVLVAELDIAEGKEILVDYRDHTLNERYL